MRAIGWVLATALAAAAGAAHGLPLYYVQETCGDCSPVAAAGVDSSAPIMPVPQTRARTEANGATAVVSVTAAAAPWLLGAASSAGVIIPVAGSVVGTGSVKTVATMIREVPLTPTALFPLGTAITLSLNYRLEGTLQTPVFAPPPFCCLLNGSSEVVVATASFLTANVAPQAFLDDLHRFGFAADFNDDGQVHAFGDGSVFATGGLSGVGPDGNFVANLTTQPRTVHIGDTLVVGLGLFTAASESSAIPGAFSAIADLSHTLTLPTDRPVFNLPHGYSITTDDGLIVDDRFVGPNVNPVPAPSALALVLPGLALVATRREGVDAELAARLRRRLDALRALARFRRPRPAEPLRGYASDGTALRGF